MLVTKSSLIHPWKWSSRPSPRQALLFWAELVPPSWLLLFPLVLVTRRYTGGQGLASTAKSTDALALQPGQSPFHNNIMIGSSLLSTYFMSGTVPSVLLQILTRTPRSRHKYPRITDEETEAQRGNDLAKVIAGKDTAGI